MQDVRAQCPPSDDRASFDCPDSRAEIRVDIVDRDSARDTLELADAHLAAAQWTDACALFHTLAAGHPENHEYRARMHYARGRDYLGARQYRNARAELRRALELDPTLTVAADALDAVTSLLSKLFRR